MTYPTYICFECGLRHCNNGNGTGRCCTVHEGKCGICGKVRAVTEPRDFGHLKESFLKANKINIPKKTNRC